MEMPPRPDATFCAGCNEQLAWLWSPRVEAWVAFIPCDCGGQWSLKPHGCQSGQDGPVWKRMYRGDPPSAEYLEAKSKLNEKE